MPIYLGGTQVLEGDAEEFVYAAQYAIDMALKADLDSPTFEGTPTAPTVAQGDGSTLLANTAFVQNEVDLLVAAIALKADAAATDVSINDLDLRLTQSEEDIVAAVGRLDGHDTELADHETRIAAAEATVVTHTDDILTLGDAVTDLENGKVDTTITVNGHTLDANVTVSAADVGLGNVDNTADADKPVSTDQAVAIADAVSGTLKYLDHGVDGTTYSVTYGESANADDVIGTSITLTPPTASSKLLITVNVTGDIRQTGTDDDSMGTLYLRYYDAAGALQDLGMPMSMGWINMTVNAQRMAWTASFEAYLDETQVNADGDWEIVFYYINSSDGTAGYEGAFYINSSHWVAKEVIP